MLSISDINELNLPKTCQTEFPDPDDLLNFKLIICPDEVGAGCDSGAATGMCGVNLTRSRGHLLMCLVILMMR